MKKIKSLLALLLLGGMVLSGCGDKDKGGNPSDSGTPSQQGGSGDQGGSGNGDSSGGGNQGGGDQGGGGNQGGGETIVASWPSTTVQMYLDLLGVEHDRVPSIQNDAITSYAITSDATAVQTEQGFTIACVGGGSLLNSYVDTLLANGYTYRENVGCYMTPLEEVCIGLDAIEGNLVIIVMLPNAGGGGGGGGGEVPTDSQFVNKKFVFDSLSCPQDQSLEATLTANYQGAYAALFSNGKFQLVSVVNTYTMALLGDFTVAQDDSYARLDVRKEYDGETQGYEYLESGTFVTNLRYNEGLQKYVLPMRNSNGMGGTINFDVYLNLSNEAPEAADLPDDPNGENFDPAYQVRKDVWDRLIVNRDLIHSSAANYVVTSGSSVFEIDNGTKFYEHADSATQGNGTYYVRTSINAPSYNYDVTVVTGGVAGPSDSVEYMIDQFDIQTGVAPIPFNWMQYNSVGHYYWRDSYTYQHSTQGSRTLNNYRVYFGANYRIQKITFTDNAQQEFEFIYSNHTHVEVTIPGEEISTDPNDYYQYVQNKTLVYDSAQQGDLNDAQFTAVQSANSNIKFSVFSNNAVEIEWPDHFYYNNVILEKHVVMYGSLQYTQFMGTYVKGRVVFTAHYVDGVLQGENPENMVLRWNIEGGQMRLQMEDEANYYFILLNVTNIAPSHIPQPDPSSSPDPTYVAAMQNFEDYSGIELPEVLGLTANFYTYSTYCAFYTGDGATSETLETYVNFFNTNYSGWSHVGPATALNITRHTFTSGNYDVVSIEFNDCGSTTSYIVITYTPGPEAPAFYYNDGYSWSYTALEQDPDNDDQYRILGVYITAGDQFSLLVGDSDWRYFENLNTGNSDASIYLEQGGQGPNTAKHYFRANASGYYNIYVKKDSSAESGFNVFINANKYVNYPLTSIQSDLAGATDGYIDFVAFNASYDYVSATEDPSMPYGVLTIELEDDDTALAEYNSFASSLLGLGYHKIIETTTIGDIVYISPNKQVAFALAYYSNVVMVGLINLVNNPDPSAFAFDAAYQFVTDNVGWDGDSAEFYAWVWGEGITSHWVELQLEYDELSVPYLAIELPEGVSGLKIVRVNPGAENKPVVGGEVYGNYASSEVWNNTGDISLPGYNAIINFGFENWLNP